MKLIALAVACTLLGSAGAIAEETTVIHRDSSPSVTVETREAPAVVEKRTVTTGTTGCGSTTVHKENDRGDSKTVTKENC